MSGAASQHFQQHTPTSSAGDLEPRHPLPTRRNPRRQHTTYTRFISWVWRIEVWVEGCFALGLFELWEKILVCLVFSALFSLIWWSLFFHLPNHLRSVVSRAIYYIFGTTPSASSSSISTTKELLQSIAQEIANSGVNTSNKEGFKTHIEL